MVQAANNDLAVAGGNVWGNVCAVAQTRSIAAFVVDGVIRDLAETRERRFPVFARGVIPGPGARTGPGVLNGPVRCGGGEVRSADVVVADEEGIVVVPAERAATVLWEAQARAAKAETGTLEAWEAAHRARIDEILRGKGLL